MKKLLYLMFICLCSIGFVGCDLPDEPPLTETSRVSLGKIVDSTIMSTYNRQDKTLVKTEKANVVIYSIISIDIGVEAFSISYNNGKRYFTWVGSPIMYGY